MPPLYSRADILMLTSDWEGTPNVLLEAMATGLPVLATAVGGVPLVVRDGETGYLVDVADENRLGERLHELASDRGLRLRLGAEGTRFVEEHYSLASLPRSLAAIYGKILA
jgi:glycosyltransferase involved in cell wall biosynthesis